jgi:hypothetical protein
MSNDSPNTSNPSLSVTKNVNGNNAVDWFKKKTGTALKKVNRLEEKFNQAIGKAQRTEDEQFESNVNAFEEQSQSAGLFSKELNKYIISLRETQKNQKCFFECLKQVYETTWPGYNELIQQCQKQEELWGNHIELLQQCVQVPVNQYLKEFPECRKQIEKRDNKLLDYDKARHNLHDLESAKKPDESRIHRAKLDSLEKQKLFSDLNKDLHLKLPELYEERKFVYSKSFKSIFNIEKSFYNNMCESKQVLNDVCERLIEVFNCNNDGDHYKYSDDDDGEEEDEEFSKRKSNTQKSLSSSSSTSSFNSPKSDKIVENSNIMRVLFRVRAIYSYDSKEVDELAFNKDDLIDVIEGTEIEKEDLDDGWLIGIHCQSYARGLFPENFTKHV